jgi:hypothetical protein
MRWMIVESETVIKRLIKDRSINIFERHYEYRYLKLLFRRLASFKATYLLRKDTLANLMLLYDGNRKQKVEWEKYKQIKKNAIKNLNALIANNEIDPSSIKDILASIRKEDLNEIFTENTIFVNKVPSNVENKLRYYCQVLHNCNDIFKLLHSSPSFLASCLKEVVHENIDKAKFLDLNIEALRKDHGHEIINYNPDFDHFLLLLKLENTNVNEVIEDEYIKYIKNTIPYPNLREKENEANPSETLENFLKNVKDILYKD